MEGLWTEKGILIVLPYFFTISLPSSVPAIKVQGH